MYFTGIAFNLAKEADNSPNSELHLFVQFVVFKNLDIENRNCIALQSGRDQIVVWTFDWQVWYV